MKDVLEFAHRQAFREWLEAHAADHDGVWLLFGKQGGPVTLSASDALDEALCFGWIDGQMQSLGDASYKKYFSRRRPNSHWSEKNKRLAQALVEQGLMTEQGMEAIERAKASGVWESSGRVAIDDEQVQAFREIVREYEPAYTHLMAMPLSVQRTYTGFYLDAKSDKTHQARLEKIIDRLNKNLKPM